MAKGKIIGGCIYIHKDYVDHVWGDLSDDIARLPEHFRDKYTLIKIDKTTTAVTFIQCDDFDTAHEPTMGHAWLVKPNGQVRHIKPHKDPWIYHHKWMMVDRDYEGFDVEASKRRSEALDALTNVNRRRIGKKSYWETYVVPHLEALCN